MLKQSEFEQNIELPQSKKRKTAHNGEDMYMLNPMRNFNLKVENLERDLDSQNTEIDYAFNSFKKRKFTKIDEHFVSKIPKPGKNVMIISSKYQDYPSIIYKK